MGPVRTLLSRGGAGSVVCVCIVPYVTAGGLRIIAASADGTLTLHDFRCDRASSSIISECSVLGKVSPVATLVALGSGNPSTLSLFAGLDGVSGTIVPILASKTVESTWALSTGRSIRHHAEEVCSVACHSRLPLLASVDDDGTLAITESRTGKLLALARSAHNSVAACAAWEPAERPDGEASGVLRARLLTCGFDHRIVLWGVDAQCRAEKLPAASCGAGAEDGDADGGTVASVIAGSAKSKVPPRAKKGVRCKGTFAGESVTLCETGVGVSIHSVQLLPLREWDAGAQCVSRALLASSKGAAKAVKTFGRRDGGFPKPGASVFDQRYSGDGAADICGAISDGTLAPVASNRQLLNPPFVYSVAWADPGMREPSRLVDGGSGALFAAASGDGTVYVLSADSGQVAASWEAHGAAATCVAFVPNRTASDVRIPIPALATSIAGASSASCTIHALPTAPTTLVSPGAPRDFMLFSAGNDRQLKLWRVTLARSETMPLPASIAPEKTVELSTVATMVATKGPAGIDAASPVEPPSTTTPLPIPACLLWGQKHARGGINSIAVAWLPSTRRGPPAAVDECGVEEVAVIAPPALSLLVCDVTACPALYSWTHAH